MSIKRGCWNPDIAALKNLKAKKGNKNPKKPKKEREKSVFEKDWHQN